MEFDDSVSTAQAQAAGLGGNNTSSGFSSDLGSGDSAEDFNSFVVGSNPKEIAAGGLGGFDVYTMVRGATADNPYPESFFSKMFGADNVNYAKSMGRDRVREINQLRYRQATGQVSEKTGEQYKMGDYYLGQDTNLGTVKEVPQTGIMNLMDNLPGIGPISRVLGKNRGLPEDDPRRIAMMEEQAKSANEPSFVSGILNTGKNVLNDISTGAKDYFSGIFPPPPPSPVASPLQNVRREVIPNLSDRRGQFGVPDNRTFDTFGNVTGSALDTSDRFKTIEQLSEDRKRQNAINAVTDMLQVKPKYEQQADLSQTFKNMGNEMNQYMGADGKKIGEGNLRIAPNIEDNNLQLQYKLPISKYIDRFFG